MAIEEFGEKCGIAPLFANEESFTRSDQLAFAKAGIPSILIMDGLNYHHIDYAQALKKWIDWRENYYHTPFDDLSQPYDLAAALQHSRFLYHFADVLVNIAKPPEWKSGTTYINARLQSMAEKK